MCTICETYTHIPTVTIYIVRHPYNHSNPPHANPHAHMNTHTPVHVHTNIHTLQECTLSEILDEDDVLQESKAQNKKLIDL